MSLPTHINFLPFRCKNLLFGTVYKVSSGAEETHDAILKGRNENVKIFEEIPEAFET